MISGIKIVAVGDVLRFLAATAAANATAVEESIGGNSKKIDLDLFGVG